MGRPIDPFRYDPARSDPTRPIRPILRGNGRLLVRAGRRMPQRVNLLSAATLAALLMFLPAKSPCESRSRYFQLTRPTLDTGFNYEFETEVRKSLERETEDTSNRFREWLDISTEGWVYHPELLKFRLRFQPEWDQASEAHDPGDAGESGGYSSFSPAYDLHGVFLQSKPYTLSIFAQQDKTTLQSAFTQKSEAEIGSFGAELRLKNRLVPASLSYTHRSTEQTGFYTSDTESDDFQVSMNHKAKKSTTDLRANYNERKTRANGFSTRIESITGSIRNYLDLTEDKRITLSSSLATRWSQSDFLETSGLRLSEILFWKHGKQLRSDYTASYSQNRYGDFETETTAIGAGLTHTLYENLTTTLGGQMSRSDFAGGSENSYSGTLHFDYNRKIPWGNINFDMGYDYKRTYRDIVRRLIHAVDEPHVLAAVSPTFLGNENIDIGSIRVTDETGAILYIRDIDYRIEEMGSFIRISRIPFGSIEPGGKVLVSYLYLTDPAFDDDLFTQSYGVNLNLWSALTFFGRVTHSQQAVLSGPPPDSPIDDTLVTAGFRFSWKWTDTSFTYENAERNSGISTERWIAQENLTFRPLEPVAVMLSAYYGNTWFKESGEEEELYGTRCSIDWAVSKSLKLGAAGFYDLVSGVSGDTVDSGLAASLDLSYGMWSGGIGYKYIQEENSFSEESRTIHFLGLQIVRKFW